jgi:hypothetical protein
VGEQHRRYARYAFTEPGVAVLSSVFFMIPGIAELLQSR